jgi:hypothetical protein
LPDPRLDLTKLEAGMLDVHGEPTESVILTDLPAEEPREGGIAAASALVMSPARQASWTESVSVSTPAWRHLPHHETAIRLDPQSGV